MESASENTQANAAELYAAISEVLSKIPEKHLWQGSHLDLLAALKDIFPEQFADDTPTTRQEVERRRHQRAREAVLGVSLRPYIDEDGWEDVSVYAPKISSEKIAVYFAERTGANTSRGYWLAAPLGSNFGAVEKFIAKLPPSLVTAFFSSIGWQRI